MSAKFCPQEIIVQMLLRLPIRSLMRFRCVSKLWKDIISDPYFIKSFSKNNGSQLNLLFGITSETSNKLSHQRIWFSRGHVDGQLCNGTTLNLEVPSYDWRIIGSCNGIVCLKHTHGIWTSNDRYSVYLLNPTLYQCRKLPSSSFNFPRTSSVESPMFHFALGFDIAGDDYKVVNIVEYKNAGKRQCGIQVYSLRTDSWKHVGFKDVSFVFTSSEPLSANGSIYWLANEKRNGRFHSILVAFDLAREDFTKIPFCGRIFLRLRLGLVDGQVVVLHSSFDSHYILYAIMESGSSSTLCAMTEWSHTPEFTDRSLKAFTELGLLLQGDTADKELLLYDLKSHTVPKKFRVKRTGCCITEAVSFVESIVPITRS